MRRPWAYEWLCHGIMTARPCFLTMFTQTHFAVGFDRVGFTPARGSIHDVVSARRGDRPRARERTGAPPAARAMRAGSLWQETPPVAMGSGNASKIRGG